MSLITFRETGFNAYGGVNQLSDFIKNILICVPKMNEGLMRLEQHEGE